MLCMNTPVYSHPVQLRFLIVSEQQHSVLVQLDVAAFCYVRSVDENMKWEQEFVTIVWRTAVLLIKL